MLNIFVHCEGNTEFNYIQRLNRLLNEENCFGIRFHPKNLTGISTKSYISEIKKQTPNKNYFDQLFIWLDYDIFQRIGKIPKELKKKL
jgi:hypothetical protein